MSCYLAIGCLQRMIVGYLLEPSQHFVVFQTDNRMSNYYSLGRVQP